MGWKGWENFRPAECGTVPKKNKYGASKTTRHGITFDSRFEADRYSELSLLELAGQIRSLQRQVAFPLVVNGMLVAEYVADFCYDERQGDTWMPVVEDTKSVATRKIAVYRLKMKLMRACHGIEVREVMRPARRR